MSSAGKKLEAWIRRVRPFVNPAHRKAYREITARGMNQRQPGEPVVCCDFSNAAIDGVGGRYYFSLVLDLMDAGYFPVFTERRLTLSTFGTSPVKKLLLERRMGTVAATAEIGAPFALITDSGVADPLAARTVRVDYEWRLPAGPAEVPFPVFVHPRIAVGNELPFSYDPAAERPARIFFGGNTSPGKYDKDVIRKVYRMLSRREMLEAVTGEVTEKNIHRPADAVAWMDSRAPHPFVLVETQVTKIPQRRWLEALSRADFFLACPGVGMPLCHNLIESLATGAVPILQYSRYLTPALRDGVNCLAFSDAASLREVVARVLAMTQEEIRRLRANVREYYDEFLAPGRFTKRLLGMADEPTLLLNSYRVPR